MTGQLQAWAAQLATNPVLLAYWAGILTGALAYRRLVRWTLGGRA